MVRKQSTHSVFVYALITLKYYLATRPPLMSHYALNTTVIA